MDESKRNYLQKRLRAVGLGCRDMEQAHVAAESLMDNELDPRLQRLLETAVAVTYMRPFTRNTLMVLDEFVPKEPPLSTVHQRLATLRDTVYAHTDREADREFFFSHGFEDAGEDDWVPYAERYVPLPKELLSDICWLCTSIRQAMLAEARRIRDELGPLHPGVDVQALDDA